MCRVCVGVRAYMYVSVYVLVYGVGGCALMDGWMDGWMAVWMDGRTDGRTHRRMDGRVCVCV